MAECAKRNIVSVSWGDHLVFGEGRGALRTIGSLNRAVEKWRNELDAGIIHWRCTRNRIRGKYFQARGYRHFSKSPQSKVDWDDFVEAPAIAHRNGLKIFLYASLFDEGWPLPPKKYREASYHNHMHCRHVSWQSDFSRKNPDFAVIDRTMAFRQWGVMCLAYPEVRRHFIRRYLRLLKAGEFDGLFVCLRSQSRPADFADQFGFNEPVRKEYLNRYGRDICKEDFDLAAWHRLLGDYLTLFLRELRSELRKQTAALAGGVPRGGIVGPPMGNMKLEWARWVEENLVDQLVIDQNSCKCPSMWHNLWPMHRGYGYRQNYCDGFNMKSLTEDLTNCYESVFQNNAARLYVARQWHPRAAAFEKSLLEHPSVTGLVFGSFRHDNPGAVLRDDWTVEA